MSAIGVLSCWLSSGVALCEQVYPLMRQPQQACSIASAHLQSPGPQHSNGASGCEGCTSIFLFGLLAECGVGAPRPGRALRQFHIVDDGGVVCVADEQTERFDGAAAGFVNGATLRVASAHT